MSTTAYTTAHITEIAPLIESEANEAEWKPVRHYFGIGSFGVNAFVAHEEGEHVIGEHTEVDESGTRHEELFFVASGDATFRVEDETFDAPAGTFVYVRDPATLRGAVARSAGTTVVAVGGEPGAAYRISPWERKYTGD